MSETIKTGAILIKDGTLLPDGLRLDTEPCAAGWSCIKNLDAHGLGRRIHEAGWTFFFLAGEARVTVFGIDADKMASRAIRQILVMLKSEFNSLEITRVSAAASKRFLGVCSVTVSARSRHVQESIVLFRTKNVQLRPQTNSFRDLNTSIELVNPLAFAMFPERLDAQAEIAIAKCLRS